MGGQDNVLVRAAQPQRRERALPLFEGRADLSSLRDPDRQVVRATPKQSSCRGNRKVAPKPGLTRASDQSASDPIGILAHREDTARSDHVQPQHLRALDDLGGVGPGVEPELADWRVTDLLQNP
jgi:hypothetical protein